MRSWAIWKVVRIASVGGLAVILMDVKQASTKSAQFLSPDHQLLRSTTPPLRVQSLAQRLNHG